MSDLVPWASVERGAREAQHFWLSVIDEVRRRRVRTAVMVYCHDFQ